MFSLSLEQIIICLSTPTIGMSLSYRDPNEGDGMILCEWHSHGYGALILIAFILVWPWVTQSGCLQNIWISFCNLLDNFVLSFMFVWITNPTLSDTKILLQLQFSCIIHLKYCEMLWWVETFTNMACQC